MRHALTFFFTLLGFAALAQTLQPIQIQTIDTSKFVVEYIPIATAQKNVDAKLVQVNKQLEQVEKQMAELVKRRDELILQKVTLEFADAQLDQAAAAPASQSVETPAPTTPPPAKKSTKKKKTKN